MQLLQTLKIGRNGLVLIQLSRSLLLDAPLGVVASFSHVIRLTKVGVMERKLVVQSSSNLILVREGFEAL